MLIAVFHSYAGQAPDPAGHPTWTLTGSLRHARAGFQATALLDGRVLVEGGFSNTGAVRRSELFDPASKTWSNSGSMVVPRSNHTATLLEDGRVLVAGGQGLSHGQSAANVAELYDPVLGRWTETGKMRAERPLGLSAVRLQDGRVLVAGGTGNGDVLSSAEIYDPASETWTLTGDMGIKVYAFALTLLPDGKVLLAGGLFEPPATSSTALLYDPASGSWQPTGSLNTSRCSHSATLLENGQVLVAGGESGTGLNIGSVDSSELYDPTTGIWTLTGNLRIARAGQTATRLLDGSVVVTGGDFIIPNGDITTLQSTEVYNPGTGKWGINGALNVRTVGHAAALLQDGEIVVAGGEALQNGHSHTWAVSQVGPP